MINFVAFSLYYVLGIFFSEYIINKHFIQIMIGIILLGAALFFLLKRKNNIYAKSLIAMPILVGIGAFSYSYVTNHIGSELYDYTGQNITIIGRVSTIPAAYDEKYSFLLDGRSCIFQDDSENKIELHEKIKVTSANNFSYGDTITVSGKLKEIQRPKNSTSFDSKSYYQKQGIYCALFAEEAYKNDIAIKSYDLRAYFIRTASQFIDKYFIGSRRSLLLAIIANQKSSMESTLKSSLVKTGIYRYLYCPYIHVFILVFLCGMLQYTIPVKFRRISLIICLLGYLALNSTLASAWKLCLLGAIGAADNIIFKRQSPRDTFGKMILITAILYPQMIRDAGFIMSVSATIMIKVFYKRLYRAIIPYVKSTRLAMVIIIYLIVGIGLMPLSVLFFGKFNTISMLLSYLAIPLIILFYIWFYASFIIYLCTGIFYGFGLNFFLDLMLFAAKKLEVMPFVNIVIGKPSTIFLILWALIILKIYLHYEYKKLFKLINYPIAALFIALACTYGYSLNKVEVAFVNVGQGDCSVISDALGKTVVIDGGGVPNYMNSDYDVGLMELIPYLNSKGINKVDYAIVSHYHEDHAKGIISLLKNKTVSNVLLPDCMEDNELREEICKECRAQGTKITYINNKNEGQTMKLTKKLDCKFLYSDYQTTFSDTNDTSLIFKISYGDMDIVYTGDASKKIENIIDINCDGEILKVAHHGSDTSSGDEFLDKVGAEYSVICVGENNSYHLPKEDVIDRLKVHNTKILRTDQNGDIHFILSKKKIVNVSCFRDN